MRKTVMLASKIQGGASRNRFEQQGCLAAAARVEFICSFSIEQFVSFAIVTPDHEA